jgi:hypothetical protein
VMEGIYCAVLERQSEIGCAPPALRATSP